MADQTRRPGPDAEHTTEDNQAQRQRDATPDAVAEAEGRGLRETSDRTAGRGSDANGVPASDEAEGGERKKLYGGGATLVSKID